MAGSKSLGERIAAWARRQGVDLGRVVAAVSGGADSVALACALAEGQVRRRAAGQRLVVAHFNHRLRGAESDGDEAFVTQLHGRLAAECPWLTLRCGGADVARLARERRSNLEAAAREVRYAWLAEVAWQEGIGLVATGHTADDQAETVLHHLLRGTGWRGLRGIAPRRPLADRVEVVRPLLEVRRSEVEEYLRERGQDFRQDSTNQDRTLTRNRIRHDLLPRLAAEYNPDVVGVLGRLAEQAGEVCRREEEAAAELLARAERPPAGTRLIFDREVLAAAPAGVVREVFRTVWRREAWSQGEMGFEAWERVAAVARGEQPAVDLPGGVRVQGQGRVVQVERCS